MLKKNSQRDLIMNAAISGICTLFVHAKDEQASTFYEHFNFRPSPTNPQHLFLLMKDILKIAG